MGTRFPFFLSLFGFFFSRFSVRRLLSGAAAAAAALCLSRSLSASRSHALVSKKITTPSPTVDQRAEKVESFLFFFFFHSQKLSFFFPSTLKSHVWSNKERGRNVSKKDKTVILLISFYCLTFLVQRGGGVQRDADEAGSGRRGGQTER